METNSESFPHPTQMDETDLLQDVGAGVPVSVDDEEPTLAIPYETNREVSDGRLR